MGKIILTFLDIFLLARMKFTAVLFTLMIINAAIAADIRLLSKSKVVAKAPVTKKTKAGPAPAPIKKAPAKPATKATPKPAPKSAKKPAGAKPAVKKSVKADVKNQKTKQAKREQKNKSVEKSGDKPQKPGKNPESKKSLPHPKKNLKQALAGVSNKGKVGKNLDYSKLVVDSLNKYHQLVKAVAKKDMKKYATLKAWVSKNAHMTTKKFMSRFKSGASKIKIEVLTNGASKSTHSMPEELRKKIDKDDLADELNKFKTGEAKGRVMPKKIRDTVKKIKNGKITDTKVGHIGGYEYLFVYVHQNAPTL